MSYHTFAKSAAPSAPAAGKATKFIDANGRPCVLDATGVLSIMVNRDLPNFIRNSGLWFAQRQVPGTLTTYSNTTGRAITADGWGVTNENASVQFIRTDTSGAFETGLQARNYGTWSKITTTGKFVLSQVIEGADVANFRGRTTRFQCWLKASASKTIKIAVAQLTSAGTIDTMPATFISAFGANSVDPTLGTNLSYLAPKAGVTGDNCTAGTNAFSCAVTTAWQKFGGVVDVPTTAKNVVVLVFTDSQFVAADSLSMSQASFTDGYEIQDWNPRPYQEEMESVMRFYQKSFNIDTNPAQNVGVNTGEFRFTSAVAASIAFAGVGYTFPVRMRVAPVTLTLYNPAAANAQIRNVTLSTDTTGAAATANGEQGFYVGGTTPASTAAGNSLAVHWSADAEL